MLRAHGYHPEPATPADDPGGSSAAEGGLLLSEERALARPDQVATVLVHGGAPPCGLHLEEEDLETYFLRTIGQLPPTLQIQGERPRQAGLAGQLAEEGSRDA
ncbi:hypothetical protein [Nonomuraea lactucae]|uniref:hypothetical protein n=1 Tax=Nonomuraea lactucae TaxID=2249762 RepID=UPI001F068699|nr:hypothetical protein [Nonomuraea lactucae]